MGEEMEIVEPSKELLELVRIILEQNGIILMSNKLLLEKLSAPPLVIKSKAK